MNPRQAWQAWRAKARGRARWTPRALLWLTPLVLLSPALWPGRALFWGTPSLQFVPWHWWAWETLRQGHLPLWNPLLGGGAPLAANYQSALFYPPNGVLVVFAALGGLEGMAWAHGLLAFLHLVLAGYGMAKLLDDFHVQEPAPTVAGLAYALSGYLVARLGFFSVNAATAWLPWLLWASRRVAERPTRRRVAGLAALWGLQLLSGHAQTAWYSGLLMALWSLLWVRRPFWPRIFALMAAGLLGAALAAVQLLPTAAYLLQSQRAGGAPAWALDYSLWPWHLLTLLAPDAFGNPAQGNYWGYGAFWEDAMYVGLLPLVLAWHGLRRAPSRRLRWWAAGVLLAGFLLALGKFTPVFMWLYAHVPTFDAFKAPARWLLWVDVVLALLAGWGVAQWRRPEGRALYWTRLGTAGAFAVALGAGLAWWLAGDVKMTLVRALALTGWWGLGVGALALLAPARETAPRATLWAWAVALWTAGDLLAAGWGLNPAVDAAVVYGATPPAVAAAAADVGDGRVYMPAADERRLEFGRYFRFEDFQPATGGWETLRASFLPNLTLLDGVASANNFDPMLPARYDWSVRATEVQPPAARERLWARLGVRAVVRVPAVQPYAPRVTPLAGEPLARWVPRAQWVPDGEAAWAAVARRAREGGAAWQCVVVLEGAPRPATPACSTQARVTPGTRTPNTEVWHVHAPQDGGFVVFSETWFPGWQAEVDGRRVPLYRADYLFRAVAVPEGDHVVTLRYRPAEFAWGMVLSVLAAAVLAALARPARPRG